MARPKKTTNAKEAVKAIIEDIKGRRGLSTEWNQIPFDVRQEIEVKWAKLIAGANESPEEAPACTGQLVHSEFTACPAHDPVTP